MSVRKFRVLIADDDDLQILYIKDILRDLGYESRSVSDADSVIPKMKEFDPDAVILDMQMYYKGKFNELVPNSLPKSKCIGNISLGNIIVSYTFNISSSITVRLNLLFSVVNQDKNEILK